MDSQTWINILTPVVTPLIVLLVKLIWIKIPTSIIPVLAAVIGSMGNLAANYLAGHPGDVTLAIALGLAAIGCREIVDQLKKPQTNPTP